MRNLVISPDPIQKVTHMTNLTERGERKESLRTCFPMARKTGFCKMHLPKHRDLRNLGASKFGSGTREHVEDIVDLDS